jgi:putative chitinase
MQVDGINSVLQAFDGYDIRQLAYVLATVYHETAHTMQPVREGGKGAGYDYGKKLKRGGGKGKRIPYTTPDQIYYGRGYIQVTWFENYDFTCIY